MRRYLLLFAPLLGLGCEPSRPAASAELLPLRSLRLYETGVGYFERSGDASRATSLPVPAGHLDDALKSLVLLSAGGPSRVGGLQFPSRVSKGMARALSGLPSESDAPLSYRDVLLSLKGAPVELQSGERTVRGRVIEVLGGEPPAPDEGDKKAAAASKPAELSLLLLTDEGKVERLRGAELGAVRPLDPGFSTRLGAALDALSNRSAQVQRSLELFGESRGAVTFGYVTETPTWRSSYRLVFAPGGQRGTLQGWALLHNDTEEDWRGVKLELVNGRPDAFLFPLAAPRYLRRELVHPDDPMSTIPQLLGQTPDSLWGDEGQNGAGGLGLNGIGSGGGGSGIGDSYGLGGLGRLDATTGKSDLLTVGNLSQTAQATGVESGALFRYLLAQPLTLAAHSSALVPFVEKPLESAFLTWVDSNGEGAPRSAVRFVNSTGQTLPAGPIAFFADGGFAGESTLDRLKPAERRFLTFAADLDVEIGSRLLSTHEESKRVTFEQERLQVHFLRTTRRTFELEDRSPAPRDLYVALSLKENASVTGADALDFDTAQKHPIAIFRLAPQKKVTRELVTVEGLERRSDYRQLSSEALTKLAAAATLPPADRAGLVEVAARQAELEKVRRGIADSRRELEASGKDLERLREHLKALAGDRGAAPFVKRILAGEDALLAARKRLEALEKEEPVRLEAVRAALVKLAPKTP